MARKPSPWYRSERNEWWVHIHGEDHCLGKHPDDAPKPQKSKKSKRWNAPKEIETAFHSLMRGDKPQPTNDDTVIAVLDDFITWCKENREQRTWQRYEDFIQDFVKADDGGLKFGAIGALHLNTGHVTKWLNQRGTWGPTTKKNAITALQRGFNWAVKNRGLPRNPIQGMEKPQAKKRVEVVTPAEFEEAMGHVSPWFKDLLVVSYDSGARPFEIKELEARHVQLDKERAVIPAEEAKGRKRPRVFYFPTERSLEIITRLVNERPEGPLFLNRRKNKWTGFAVKCGFARLEKITGKRIQHYALRHSRITDWLVSGVDSHVVAKLSGHTDSKMIDTTYSHVQDDYEFMLKNAKKRANPKKDS